MSKSTLAIGAALAIASGVTVASVALDVVEETQHRLSIEQGATFSLIMDYRHDSYVIDTDLSLSDCIHMEELNKPGYNFALTCEVEQ